MKKDIFDGQVAAKIADLDFNYGNSGGLVAAAEAYLCGLPNDQFQAARSDLSHRVLGCRPTAASEAALVRQIRLDAARVILAGV